MLAAWVALTCVCADAKETGTFVVDDDCDGLKKTGVFISVTAGDRKVSTAKQRPGTGWREPHAVDFIICAFRRY